MHQAQECSKCKVRGRGKCQRFCRWARVCPPDNTRAKLVINVARGDVSRPHTRARAMAGPLIASGIIARHNGCSLRRRRREEVGSVCRRVAQSRSHARKVPVTCGSEQLRADNMIHPHTAFAAMLAHHARTTHVTWESSHLECTGMLVLGHMKLRVSHKLTLAAILCLLDPVLDQRLAVRS
jgi:hypothetical protein